MIRDCDQIMTEWQIRQGLLVCVCVLVYTQSTYNHLSNCRSP